MLNPEGYKSEEPCIESMCSKAACWGEQPQSRASNCRKQASVLSDTGADRGPTAKVSQLEPFLGSLRTGVDGGTEIPKLLLAPILARINREIAL